jgi:hypothetical protein
LVARLIFAHLAALRTRKIHLSAQAARGSWEAHGETLMKIAQGEREFGKIMYDEILDYIRGVEEKMS